MIPWLGRDLAFPPLASALAEPNGLLAAGGDLSPKRLLAAYRHGMFPWFSEGDPILWWSPDPRMVLVPADFRVHRSLAKTLRNKPHEVRFDTAFDDGHPPLRRTTGGRTGHLDHRRRCAPPTSGCIGLGVRAQRRDLDRRRPRRRALRRGHRADVLRRVDVLAGTRRFQDRAGRTWRGACSGRLRTHRLPDAHRRLASLGAREMPRAEFLRRVSELVDYEGRPGPWTDWRESGWPASAENTTHTCPG